MQDLTSLSLVVDVWEGQDPLDIDALVSNGVSGIGIRLNDMNGGHHLDEKFLSHWEAVADKLVKFPYFVYNPWVTGDVNFEWLSHYIPSGVLCFALDVEVRYSKVSTTQYTAYILRFLELCKGRGLKVIIYTGQWFLQYLSSWPTNVDYWWAQYPQPDYYLPDVHDWATLREKLSSFPDVPMNSRFIPGTDRLKLWQFSGDWLKLPGSDHAIDVNLFYGNASDLQDYFGNGGITVPVPPVTVRSNLYSVTDPSNYFSRPGGGPLTLPMTRAYGKLGDNMNNYLWPELKSVIAKINPSNLADAVDKCSAPDWGPSKGLEIVGKKPNVREVNHWIGLLWPGRNIVKIENIDGYWGQVTSTLSMAQALRLTNPFDHPDQVHMIYDFNNASGYGLRKKPVYVPLLDGNDDMPWWVDMRKLVSLDSYLPRLITVTAAPYLNVRSEATTAASVVGRIVQGKTIMIYQIKVGERGIWGKTDSGWIALRFNGDNFSDWIV